ncbi:MAG TPA: lipopolysaccharide biosynthesis protein [Candidatus Binataceae bacterium]|nr:lipopolysaccharide biosynthesis protein [Candidatus Binataceae bacterium]
MPETPITESATEMGTRPGRRAMSSIIWSYANWASTILSPLVMVPLYVRFLGAKTYGQWLVILSVSSYLGLANLGLGQTISNRIAEAGASRGESEVSRLLATAFVSYATLAVVLLAALAVLTPLFAGPLNLGGSPGLLVAFGVYVALNLASFPLRIFPMLLRGFQRVDLEQRIGVTANVARIAALAVALAVGLKLLSVAIINGATMIASCVAAFLWTRGLGPQARLRVSNFSNGMLREMIRPSIAFLGIQASSVLIMGTDNLVIGYAIGSGAVTRYAVPFRLTYMATSLFGVALGALVPTITAAYARGAHDELRRWLLLSMRLALLYATAGAIALWIAGPSFIRLWAGPAVFPGMATFGLQICQFWSMVWVASASALLWSTTRHYFWSAFSVLEGVLNLLLSLFAVWRWGLAGVIGATITASILTEFWYLPGAAFKLLQIPLRQVLRELGPALLLSFGTLIVVLLFGLGFDAGVPLTRCIGRTALIEAPFIAAFALIGLTRADRAIILGRLGRPPAQPDAA